jgi:hypothetical protein
MRKKLFLISVLASALFGGFVGFLGINCVHEAGHYSVAYLSGATVTGAWCWDLNNFALILAPLQMHVGGEVSVADPSVLNFYETAAWFLMGGIATFLLAAFVIFQLNKLLKTGNSGKVFMVTSFMLGVVASITPSITMGWSSDVYKFLLFLSFPYPAQLLLALLVVASVVYYILMIRIAFRYTFSLTKIVFPEKLDKIEKNMKKIPGIFR